MTVLQGNFDGLEGFQQPSGEIIRPSVFFIPITQNRSLLRHRLRAAAFAIAWRIGGKPVCGLLGVRKCTSMGGVCDILSASVSNTAA